MNSTEYILTLLNLKGIGPAFIKNQLGILRECIAKGITLSAFLAENSKKEYSSDAIQDAEKKAQTSIELIRREEINTVNVFQKDYPKILLENMRWPIIYFKGTDILPQNIAGIIGSRDSTSVSVQIAERLGIAVVKAEYHVLTGLAEGIDQAAVNGQGVLQKTIGVLPSGLAYQSSKLLGKAYREQADRVLEGGGILVSGFAPSVPQDQYKLVEYCKLQGSLSNALFLVQTKVDGGSRYTVEAFARFDRPLGVVDVGKYDSEKDAYTGNRLLLDEKKEGVSTFTGLSIKKVKCNVIPVKTKSDYEKVLNKKGLSTNQLF